MKSFKDYVAEMQTMGDDDMGKMKVVAEQVDDSIVFYNSEKDRWSRNAKHPLQVSEAIDMSDNNWTKGDLAVYNGNEVKIEIPQGPNNTVGILYEGKLKIAKLNIDENAQTPAKFGIRGIPTLMIFKNGNVEATKVGALSKSQLTTFIDSNI